MKIVNAPSTSIFAPITREVALYESNSRLYGPMSAAAIAAADVVTGVAGTTLSISGKAMSELADGAEYVGKSAGDFVAGTYAALGNVATGAEALGKEIGADVASAAATLGSVAGDVFDAVVADPITTIAQAALGLG